MPTGSIPIYRALASRIYGYTQCHHNIEHPGSAPARIEGQEPRAYWAERANEHHAAVTRIIRDHIGPAVNLRHVFLDWVASTPERLVFTAEFWPDGSSRRDVFRLSVMASLVWGIRVRIAGKDSSDSKDSIVESFCTALEEPIKREEA